MADGISFERARRFRRRLTPPEARLWRNLKGDKLAGLGFRKQHPIGPYILDFYCAGAKLAVEVDGASHDAEERAAHDARRTRWLATKGVRVIRIRALAVRDELDGVLDFIRREAELRLERQTSDAGAAPSVTPRIRGAPPPHSRRERGGELD